MKRRRAQLAMVKPAAAVVLVLLLIIGVSWASCRKKKAAEAPAVQLTTDVIISTQEFADAKREHAAPAPAPASDDGFLADPLDDASLPFN